jgi:hypothetical protein
MVRPGQKILGKQFGIKFQARGSDDPHICVQLLGEDDENWFDFGDRFSSYWIRDLIEQLQAAEQLLAHHEEPSGFGYRFDDDALEESTPSE